MTTSSGCSAPVEHLAHGREAVAVEAAAVARPVRARRLTTGRASLRPGGPAKAWAMSSQRSASGPVATRSRSSRWRRWVTRRQKSYAEPRHRLRGVVRSPRPQLARGCDELDPELLGWAARGRARRRRSCGCGRRGGRRAGPGRSARASMPERLGHVERVRPGLHEARRGHRRRAHRRTEPRHLLPGGVVAQRLLQGRLAPARHRSSSVGRRRPAPPASASAST